MNAPVLLALEAERRGFTRARYQHPLLAARRWLRRLRVRIIACGGQELVVPAEIDAAVLRAAAPADAPALASDVAVLVASAKGGQR